MANEKKVSILTLWQDDDALNKSEQGVLPELSKKSSKFLENWSRIENYKVFSTELFHRTQ
jgi:hypothetical protein